MRYICFFVLVLLPNYSYSAQCYKWINNSNHKVVLEFVYLDNTYQPTGQINRYPLDARKQYPSNTENCYGLNTYSYVNVINGNASWDVKKVIFGDAPSGAYYIN